ncbi:MAG: hypothetical protein Q4A75_01580 [Peptostreptococcaceae bacterium]|nr:hypothetical protein [Peptostreptococcaceae bacterium]
MGRPTNNARNKQITVRLAEDELERLQVCADAKNTTRANIIVEGIEKVYQEIKEKK